MCVCKKSSVHDLCEIVLTWHMNNYFIMKSLGATIDSNPQQLLNTCCEQSIQMFQSMTANVSKPFISFLTMTN